MNEYDARPDEETWGIAERAAEKPVEELTHEEEEAVLDVALHLQSRANKIVRRMRGA